MRKLGIVFICLLSMFSAVASGVKITKSAAVETYTASGSGSIKYKGNVFFTEGHYKKQWMLRVFNTDNQQLVSERVVCKGRSDKGDVKSLMYQPDAFVELNGKLYLCFRYTDKKEDEFALYYRELNADGSFAGSMKKIASVDMPKKKKRGHFNYLISADNSKCAVYHSSWEEIENGKLQLKMLYFDNQFDKPEDKRVSIKVNPKHFSHTGTQLLNDGSFLFRGWYTSDEYRGVKFHYYHLNPESKRTEDYSVNFPNKNIGSLVSTLSEDQNSILVGGVYINIPDKKRKAESLNGVFACQVKLKEQTVGKVSYKAFGKEFIALDQDLKSVSKVKDGMGLDNSLSYKKTLWHDDGSCTMLFERYDSYTTCYETSTGKSCTTTTYHRGIIGLGIEADGGVKYLATYWKNQLGSGTNNLYSSFAALEKDGSVKILYNGLKQGKDGPVKTFKKSSLYEVTISPNGKVSEKVLDVKPVDKWVMAPRYTLYNGRNELFLSYVRCNFSKKQFNNWKMNHRYTTIRVD